jgi:hypothetical protein
MAAVFRVNDCAGVVSEGEAKVWFDGPEHDGVIEALRAGEGLYLY